MRYVPLLMMTGLGFTLGVLCSLLLQLPAYHNLPHHSPTNLHRDRHTDQGGFRSRRSFSREQLFAAANEPDGLVVTGSEGELPSPPDTDSVVMSGAKPGTSQRRHDPEMDSNLFVSSGGTINNAHPHGHSPPGHDVGEAERNDQSVKAAVDGTKGKESNVKATTSFPHHLPSPRLPDDRPVTSFTLRLKNRGDKFVVDSAVRRPDASIQQSTAASGQSDHEVLAVRKKHNTNTKSTPSSAHLNHTSPLSAIVNGVVWSDTLENSCPKAFEPKEVARWRRRVAGMAVVRVDEGCGRMQNRLLTLKDGSQACARYRFNTDQIQGETYSYYLAQLLNITGHLPPAVLVPVDTSSPQWRGVHLDLSAAQWADGRLAVLTRWLDHLTPAHIPPELRTEQRKLHPTEDILGHKTVPELCDLLQWSDLIVFDYLTANLDRLVNNMFNKQWNSDMMNSPAHNLERTKGGSLIFLDNESGLFHGYRLLEKYQRYHEALLSSLCVFRDSTVRAVKTLYRAGTVSHELHKLLTEQEKYHKLLPYMPEKNANVLKDRLAKVHDQMVKCEAIYGR